jgi:hypothetical protein
MDEELSPTGKSRELVLDIPVEHALAVVEPINCHPLIPQLPPVFEIYPSSSFATEIFLPLMMN